MLQAITWKIHVCEVVGISSEENWRCDWLSRGVAWTDLVKRDPLLGMIPGLHVLDSDYIIQCSDPSRPVQFGGHDWLNAYAPVV